MIGKHRIAASQRHGLRLAPALVFALVAASPSPLLAATPPATLFHQGLRWIGTTTRCASLPGWTAERVFQNAKVLGPGADALCLYKWSRLSPPPTAAQVSSLFSMSGVPDLIEDVPVVEPMTPPSTSPWSAEELAFYAGLRASLLQHVGTAALLPVFPPVPRARVVVIDTAPDAPPAGVQAGSSRHGDTLAHLIEDVVCLPPVPGLPPRCAAEVTTELAMPWMQPGVLGINGGRTGTLMELARAIERAILHWDRDTLADPLTPRQLILNLSLGWEHGPSGIADCFANPAAPVGLTAQLVQRVLQYASSRGVLVFAAAGNDSGGPSPRQRLTCPGSYQGLLSSTQPRPLLMAVSGVDYADRPLESVRQLGRTSLVGTSFGGMAWGTGDQAPPSLVGSSVGTAVVSAVAALVWAQQPSWTAAAVAQAVYSGGVLVPTDPAEACPVGFSCNTRRASVCGALQAAGASVACTPAAAGGWSSPPLPTELAALIAALPGAPGNPVQVIADPPTSIIPRFMVPSAQVEPWTFPMPIQATCPTCYASMSTPGEGPHLALRNLGKPLYEPMLVVRFDPTANPLDSEQGAVTLGSFLAAGTTLEVSLPPGWTLQAAYLTAFEDALHTHSITEQIFVHR